MAFNLFMNHLLKRIPVFIGMTFLLFIFFLLIPPSQGDVSGGGGLLSLKEGTLPLPVIYIGFLLEIFKGNLGYSNFYEQEISTVISSYLPATLELLLCAFCFSFFLGLPMGILSLFYPFSPLKQTREFLEGLLKSMPSFYISLLMILFFYHQRLLPVTERIQDEMAPLSITRLYLVDSLLTLNGPSLLYAMEGLFFPVITLSLATLPFIISIISSSLAEVLEKDFVLMARSKGLSNSQVFWRHVLKTAFLPILRNLFMKMGFLFGVGIVVEIVLGWPGLGSLFHEAIIQQEYFVVLALIFTYALVFFMIRTISDFVLILSRQDRGGRFFGESI